MKMYNYFYSVTESGDKPLYATVYRAPIGHSSFSDACEHYKGRGKWGLDCRRDPAAPTSGHRLCNPGAKRFPRDGKAAQAYMMRAARAERAK